MRHKSNQKTQQMGALFTLLLFLVFVLCALFTVLIGGKVYENISARMEQNDTGNVALQYIANKVRQGDAAGMVSVHEVEDIQVLELAQAVGEQRYVTWIYFLDGSIRELFAGEDSGLGLQDGLPVMECGGLKLEQDGRILKLETIGSGAGRLMLSLRTTGGQDE